MARVHIATLKPGQCFQTATRNRIKCWQLLSIVRTEVRTKTQELKGDTLVSVVEVKEMTSINLQNLDDPSEKKKVQIGKPRHNHHYVGGYNEIPEMVELIETGVGCKNVRTVY